MKYTAPQAELVSLELNSVILFDSVEDCFLYTPSSDGGRGDKFPDYYT